MLLRREAERLQRELASYDHSRERMLRLTREATRLSDMAIVHIHRRDLKRAARLIDRAEAELAKVEGLDLPPDLREHNSLLVAYQELVEAKALHKLITDGTLLSYGESGASREAYLLGLLDLIGELRRLILNLLRRGESAQAEKIFDQMEELYEDLSALDHTALIPNFRHKMDTARHLVEATRGDVVSEARRASLERALERLAARGRRG
ncbi:MAG: haloacid dehalogenase [Candidatus Bathyarchaeia archaeon]